MSDLLAEVFPERVELEILDREPPVTKICRMSSFSDRGVTLIADDGAIADFPAGTKIKASYGDHSGFCQFASEVVETRDGAEPGDPAMIRVLAPVRIATTQRRRYVRSDVEIEVACALVDKKAMTFRSAPGEARSLGGGGMMMIIAAHPSLVLGAELALAIPAPGGDPVVAIGQIVQSVPKDDGTLQLRLAFSYVDAVGRERIERFVYRRVGGTAPAKLWASGKITQTRQQPDPSVL
jgi:c-di-GMP-binding flagellar brake protein YcgR